MLFLLLALVWLSVSVVVLAACRMAAVADAPDASAPRPLRARGAVRERIVAAPHRGRLATHR
ncbi:MAG TPA: hypothetical protein VNV37_06880 [Solirubrobacteraceae bacterium]|nr:hypothetical protein [Solirubrobacteraceae bacterium]